MPERHTPEHTTSDSILARTAWHDVEVARRAL